MDRHNRDEETQNRCISVTIEGDFSQHIHHAPMERNQYSSLDFGLKVNAAATTGGIITRFSTLANNEKSARKERREKCRLPAIKMRLPIILSSSCGVLVFRELVPAVAAPLPLLPTRLFTAPQLEHILRAIRGNAIDDCLVRICAG